MTSKQYLDFLYARKQHLEGVIEQERNATTDGSETKLQHTVRMNRRRELELDLAFVDMSIENFLKVINK